MSADNEQRELGRGDYLDQWNSKNKKILVVSTRGYVVFIDDDGDVDWETTTQYDDGASQNAKYDLKTHNRILNDAVCLEVSPCASFDIETKLHFKRLIGEAMACSFDHDYENAQKMLDAAHTFFRARSEELSSSGICDRAAQPRRYL